MSEQLTAALAARFVADSNLKRRAQFALAKLEADDIDPHGLIDLILNGATPIAQYDDDSLATSIIMEADFDADEGIEELTEADQLVACVNLIMRESGEDFR